MQITRVSVLTGKTHTLDIPCTEDQLRAWQGGELIQKAMPNLTASQREFLLSGSTQEEWDETFADDEDEEDLDPETTPETDPDAGDKLRRDDG